MRTVGAKTTAAVVRRLEDEVEAGELNGGEALRDRLIEVLAETASPQGDEGGRIHLRDQPSVLMVVGVNGTGKTTTIGKIAWHLQKELGLDVIVAAADTYRAAAVNQLAEWADRAGTQVVRGSEGGDPGAVAFDAVAAAEARDADVVICDTAGRLHTHGNLMEELAKVRRVISGGSITPPGDADRDRRDHRAERGSAGPGVRQRGGGHRCRAHQARWQREGEGSRWRSPPSSASR